MNPTIRIRLQCGSDELDIHDWSNYVVTSNGLLDSGNTVELRWQVPRAPSEGGTGNLQRLVGELRRYIDRAKQYEQEGVGDPVYLAVYWPECEDIPVPSWGRGWRYKRITDGVLAEATPGLGQGQPDFRFASDAIPVLAAMFAVKQDPDGEFAWRSDFRWACQAKEHIEPVPENGIRLWETSQNLINNGDFELDKTGWTDYELISSVNAERAKFGLRSLLILPDTDDFFGKTGTTFTDPSPSSHFIATAWFYLPCGVNETTVYLCLDDDVVAESCQACADIHDEWQRVQVEFDSDGGSTAWQVYIKCTDETTSRYFWVDGVQVEMRLSADGPTPFIEPDRHLGEVWDTCGDHHDSTSTRNEGECRVVLPIERGYATPCCGSFHCWYRPGYDNTAISGAGQATIFDWAVDGSDYIWAYFDYSTNTFELKVSGATQVQIADTFSEGDLIGVGASWDFINDEYKLYLGGVPGTTGTTAKLCPELRGHDIFWGSEYDTDNQANGDLFDCRIWGEILTDVQVEQVYEAGRGNGELPYIWSELGAYSYDDVPHGIAVKNHDDCDAGDTNWFEIGNVPGHLVAPAWTMITSDDDADYFPKKIWFGLRRREATKIRSRDLAQFIWEAEEAPSAFNWTIEPADDVARTSNGDYRQSGALGADWTTNLRWRILLTCEDYSLLNGQWRLFARLRTASPTTVDLRANVLQYGTYPISGGDSFQLRYVSGMGSGGLWEMIDFGVLDIPPTVNTERHSLGKARDTDGVYSGLVCTIELAAHGTGAEIVDCDYIMLLPEGLSGTWGDYDTVLDDYSKYVLSDTESQRPSSMLRLERTAFSGIPTGGVSFRGDNIWYPIKSSRCELMLEDYYTSHADTIGHYIARTFYVDVRLAARYRSSR